MMHRPCGECRALVGPDGCEHWRPARRTLVVGPSQRELARRKRAETAAAAADLTRGMVPGSRRWLRAANAGRRAAREAALEEKAREFLARHGLTVRPAIVHNSSTQ